MQYYIEVETNLRKSILFNDLSFEQKTYEEEGVILQIGVKKECYEVSVKAQHNQEKVIAIHHRIALGLRNYNHVIVPDCGRYFCSESQLVDFWAFEKDSLVNHIRIPLFIFTSQQDDVGLAFGLIGRAYETRFRCLEPFQSRALSAYTKTLYLEINRGFEGKPIPQEYMDQDGYLTEYLYIKDYKEGSGLSWVDQLRIFSELEREIYDIALPYNKGSLEPLWCSWTDWFSDEVTEEVILDQVKAGVSVGIKNYIIDDGWFGPGLDNDYDVELNIGDWNPDCDKIQDLKALSQKIRHLGGRPLIWCAPHAVGRKAKCYEARLPYLSRDREGKLINTANDFNVLCIRNPKAREIMADICVRLALEYDTDGAKYDLFNCIPNVECCNEEHNHDTNSMVVGLERLLNLIWTRLKTVKPDYIVELKQNYGGVHLAQYGSMMRAGDTPYSPEGNFLRTAYVQGYTPLAINDYQTITDRDRLQDSAIMVIKMMAVGIPTYSMDITNLGNCHKAMLKNYHEWYNSHIEEMKKHRQPIYNKLKVWYIEGEFTDIYFVLDSIPSLHINKDFEILNGSGSDYMVLKLCGNYEFTYYNICGEVVEKVNMACHEITSISLPTGYRLSGKKLLPI